MRNNSDVQNILLTSAGFDNKNIEVKFLELVSKPVETIKILFIPTAAIRAEQKSIIPLCKSELLHAGILEENIVSYNLDRIMESDEICSYDGIYVCGGSPQYLLDQMNKMEFYTPLQSFLHSGGVYMGVSAGSIVMAKNLTSNLGYINCILSVHDKHGSDVGLLDTNRCPNIKLNDDQAILIVNDLISVIE